MSNITEESIKTDILIFLNTLNKTISLMPSSTTVLQNNINYLNILNGGIINGITTFGFIELKKKILSFTNQPPNNSSMALTYIKNSINNK